MKTVRVHLYSQSSPVVFESVHNTYTKDGLYCVMLNDWHTVHKFPVQHIFMITEISAEEEK